MSLGVRTECSDEGTLLKPSMTSTARLHRRRQLESGGEFACARLSAACPPPCRTILFFSRRLARRRPGCTSPPSNAAAAGAPGTVGSPYRPSCAFIALSQLKGPRSVAAGQAALLARAGQRRPARRLYVRASEHTMMQARCLWGNYSYEAACAEEMRSTLDAAVQHPLDRRPGIHRMASSSSDRPGLSSEQCQSFSSVFQRM